MVSLRFPFSFSPSPHYSSRRNFRPAVTTFAAAVGAAAAAGIALYHGSKIPDLQSLEKTFNPIFSNSSTLWASLSLSDHPPPPFVDSRTGSSFPSIINDSQRLMGVGLRRKCVLGLKNIDVYAFGIYADESDVKKYLNQKYRKLPSHDLKAKNFHEDLMESDVSLTIRLQIVYGKLSIRSVRSAFEESVGSRLQKFGGPDNKELLHRFTSIFKDDYKIPKGSVIELSRDEGHVLRTKIDGKEVGSIESKVLCWSVLDLYMGEHPFDEVAKEDVRSNLASILDSIDQ